MSDFNSIPTKTSFSTTSDYVVMFIGNLWSKVTPTVLASYISDLISASVQKVKVRHITSAGAVLSTDNVVTCAGTFDVTMPNPAIVYDATNATSSQITIAMQGAGTVGINPYNSEVFYDGSSNPSYSISGSSVSFISDGTNWTVVGA